MSDEVVQLLGKVLMSLPGLYEYVAKQPEFFFHMAYRLRLPDLYLDAAKHVIGMRIAYNMHGIKDCWLNPVSSNWCIEYCSSEMALLIYAGVQDVNERVRDVNFSLRNLLTPQGREPIAGSTSWSWGLDDEWAENHRKARELILTCMKNSTEGRKHLICCGRFFPCDPFSAEGLQCLRALVKIVTDNDALRHALREYIRDKTPAILGYLDDSEIMDITMGTLRNIENAAQGSPILSHSTERCTCSRLEPWRQEILSCAACCRPQEEVPLRLSWLDEKKLLRDMSDRPWPLGCEEQEPINVVQHEMTQAPYSYLESLGLGATFCHVKNEDSGR